MEEGTKMTGRFILAVLCLAIAVSCAPGEHGNPEQWRSPLSREHPLAGRVWQPATATFVAPDQVENAAARADFVLLGEKHDNPDHHLLQAKVLRAMIRRGRRPAVVFEMIDEDRQAALDRWLAEKPRNAAGLGEAVGWGKSGWPPWETYRPIAEAALEAGLPLRAGNLAKGMTRRIGKSGLSALDAERRVRLGLDFPPSEEQAAVMRRELFDAHCGLMPEAAMSPLVDVQRARDAVLADNLVTALGDADGAVLIAGSGHARSDHGTPLYLARLAPGRRILTIRFLEVSDQDPAPAAYAEHDGGAAPFDFLWFTPRANGRDYCGELKERLGKHHRAPTGG
jgi:uncharacterized iron-regulated protein